jgi:3-hydroxyacyl-[acyl-carrier-protein] dehydratase
VAFHYVDRIFEYEPFKKIAGLKNVTRNEPFFYWLPNGDRVLSPAVITEALCQLGGWLKMASCNFQRRPVLLADEKTEYLGMARAGDQIRLSVEVVDFDEDVVITKGRAYIGQDCILKSDCCRGYLLPMEQFDDQKRMEERFTGLHKPQFASVIDDSLKGRALPSIAGKRVFEDLRFIDGIIEHKPYSHVKAFKNFAACEPYFESHFPRKPCVPGVLLLTFIGEVCQYLVKPNIDFPIRQRALVPTFIENVRFRKFVEPGDQCTLDVSVMSGDLTRDEQPVLVKAVIFANNQRVMVAEMGFQTMFHKVEAKVLPRHLESSPNQEL